MSGASFCVSCSIFYKSNLHSSCPLCEERKVASSLRAELQHQVLESDELRSRIRQLECEVETVGAIRDAVELLGSRDLAEWKALAYAWRAGSRSVLFEHESQPMCVVLNGRVFLEATSISDVVLIENLARLSGGRGTDGAMQALLGLLGDRMRVVA